MKNQEGQSTIEFIVSFAFGLAFIFLFVNMGVNFTIGYLTHYATYMSSRTYMVSDVMSVDASASEAPAQEQARKTFRRYRLSSFGINEADLKFFPFTSADTSIKQMTVGNSVTFQKKISIFKIIAGDAKATFTSESFLGKETTRADCLRRTCDAIVTSGGQPVSTSCSGLDVTIEDNGC